MYILGINAYHGDSSASLLKDGEIVAALEEERITRIKHWAGFPANAIKFCLKEAGIGIEEVDYVAVSRDPSANVSKKIMHAVKNLMVAAVMDRLANAKKISGIKDELAASLGIDPKEIRADIHDIEHHRSHMASTFFVSPFEEAAILSIDGFGDFTSTMIGYGKGNKIKVLDSVIYPHSLGIFYTTFTQFLGFDKYGDEYKVMGLAPYGKPRLVEALNDVVILKPDGLFELNPKYFNHVRKGISMSWENGSPDIAPIYTDYLVEKFGQPRQKNEELTDYHKNLAASVQQLCENVIFHILEKLHERYPCENICLTGGVAQNSVANGKVTSKTPFNRVYIPPAGHDAGTAIGAALFQYHQVLDNPRKTVMQHAYLGESFDNEDVRALLTEKQVDFTELSLPEVYQKVTECLVDGGVVGWFRGRSEFGPRALGNRSILVDPRRADAKEILNRKIKKRESFRPFAPSILREHVADYFELVDDAPFMEKVFPIKPEKHEVIPAVTHVDGTGRLQTVHRDTAPEYYALIEAFYQKTGVPILLNTSFNENEPIVNSVEEAYNCFARTKMDMLVLENIIVERTQPE